jgi:hypothetical protein
MQCFHKILKLEQLLHMVHAGCIGAGHEAIGYFSGDNSRGIALSYS